MLIVTISQVDSLLSEWNWQNHYVRAALEEKSYQLTKVQQQNVSPFHLTAKSVSYLEVHITFITVVVNDLPQKMLP